MFSNYVIYVLGSDSAKKYCRTPTPCLTNVGKRTDNFEFSEFFSVMTAEENIKSHESTGKWDNLFRNGG